MITNKETELQDASLTTLSYTSDEKGRHAELLAIAALLANGYTVLEPVTTEAYDLAIRNNLGNTLYVQVKTAFRRKDKRYGDDEYIVVPATRNNGKVYTKADADLFIAIVDNDVYMFDNREISEYWVKAKDVADKWTKLSVGLRK